MRTIQSIIEHGLAMLRENNLSGAQEVFDKLLGMMDEADPNVLAAYGTLAGQMDRPGLATFLLKAALAHSPDYALLWANLGVTYLRLGRYEAAHAAYLEALKLEPHNGFALASMAGWHVNQGNPEKAVEYGRLAIEHSDGPELPGAHNNLALGLMEMGWLEEAWPHYEYRWQLQDKIKNVRPYKAPRWDGKKVGTLAIHGEQGLGDEILFMGCFKEVAKRADRIVIECAPRLIPLFERSFGVPCYGTHDELIGGNGGEPDAYIPMASLMSVCGVPDGKPYLVPNAGVEKVQCRIGIAWKGGTAKTNKAYRTMKLEDLRLILDLPGYEFVSVQYGGAEVIGEATTAGIAAYEGDFEDLNDLIASCEIVISVCQTAIHQAGAMGVPCWVMTPRRCAWRYTGHKADYGYAQQSRFYDSVTLFRQDETESWSPVIARIAGQLGNKLLQAAE